jgi:ubiquinone/menaquinone biosynthesis C-methylase UbiE
MPGEASSSPAFRADLYRGTASYYDRYRLPYPDELIDDLCRRVDAEGGRLLDLACGPGTVTFALCDRFTEVWAVDQERETIAFAEHKSAELGVENVRWSTGRAEDVDGEEPFDLVTIGTAFHRLDRARVAGLVMRWLRPGGHVALLWSATPLGGTEPWQECYIEVFTDWLDRVDARNRLPADFEEHMEQLPHERVLEDAGFDVLGRYEFAGQHDWSVADLIGLIYSTSLLPRPVLGERADEFEADFEARMRAVEPSGIFREHTSFAYDLARRPGAS